MHPHDPRLSSSLLAELYDLEEDAYRLAVREARRLGWGPPALTLRAVAAHANEALDELRPMARARHVRIGSIGALVADTLRRAGDVVVDQLVDHEHAFRRALATFRRGMDLVELVGAAARTHEERRDREGDVDSDEVLGRWCQRWLSARERLVRDVAKQLQWFGRHPSFSRRLTHRVPFVEEDGLLFRSG